MLLHVLRTVALALRVGSITFFAFGVAPVAFHVLPSSHEAGLVVSSSLRILHALGFVCGGIFLLAVLGSITRRTLTRVSLIATALVLLMISLTAYSAFSILPRMERDRVTAGGIISGVPPSMPARIDFDRLHHVSEQVEGTVLLGGLLALVLIATDSAARQTSSRKP